MSTWVIGDVQGCFRELRTLLERIAPSSSDRIVLVGDLVNRGPDSLDVLRFLSARDPATTGAVLGNHDLHLFGRVAGLRTSGKGDTFDAVLDAPDRDDLLDWLGAQPFVRSEAGWLVVHAGCHPAWSGAELLARGEELSAAFRSDRAGTLRLLEGPAPETPDRADTPEDRLRATAKVVTRIRMVDAAGKIDRDWSGPPEGAPKRLRPWFEAWNPADDSRIAFGHWAALGLLLGGRTIGTDTGCAWGGALSAVRLEDRRVLQVSAGA